MKSIAIVSFVFLTVIRGPETAPLQVQSGQNHRIEKWSLKHSCRELRLEPTELVTVERTPEISAHLSSRCIPCSDSEARTRQTDEALPESIPLQAITAVVEEVVARIPVKHAMDETLSGL